MRIRYSKSIASQGRPTGKSGGFTMVELMITMVIGIILTAIALPQYASFMQTQSANAEINYLLDDMRFARSEALKEGQNVSLCPVTIAKPTTCSGTNEWNVGWMVYSNQGASYNTVYASTTGTILRQKSPFPNTQFTNNSAYADTLVGSVAGGGTVPTVLTYNNNGLLVGQSTGILFTLSNPNANSASTRCLWVSVLGGLYFQTPSGNPSYTAAQPSQSPTCPT